MSRFQLAVFLGCALVGAAVACPENATAKQRRVSSAACFTSNVNYDTLWFGPNGLSVLNFSHFSCPIPDDSYLRKSTVVSLDVQVYDGSNDAEYSQATAWACISYDTTTGGACGATDSSGTTFVGNDSLHPALTYWTSSYAGDFPYVSLRLPSPDVSSSVLKGIYLDDI